MLQTECTGEDCKTRRSALEEESGPLPEPPKVWGPLVKVGILNIRQWHASWGEWRIRKHSEWVDGRKAANFTQPYPCEAALPHCYLFYNRKYRFIYVRTPKSSSSTLIEHFGICSRPKPPAPPW